MATNTWIWRKGQVGIVRRGMLSDANGRVNLDDFDSVEVTARRSVTSAPVIDRVACVPDANQTQENASDGKGWFTFTTDIYTANIPVNAVGGYLLEFVCMIGTVPYYFPMNADSTRTYNKLIVQRPLS